MSALAIVIVGAASPTSAQLIVFDPNNYAQNVCHSACNIDPLSRGIGVQN